MSKTLDIIAGRLRSLTMPHTSQQTFLLDDPAPSTPIVQPIQNKPVTGDSNMSDDLTYEQLQAQIAELQAKAAAKKQQAQENALAEVSAKMRAVGITLDELAAYMGIKIGVSDPKVARASPKALYRDPANPANVWSGRGRAARWLQAYLDQGRSKEEFLIK